VSTSTPSPPEESPSTPWLSDRHWFAIAVGVYALLALGMFGALLIQSDRIVSAAWTSEIRYNFYHLRAFGFGELARGNLPLWNPHLFAGVPYAANFEAALFYPPNWIFLLLPTANAINLSVALHTFLIALFMFVWLRGRHLHPLASLTGGAVLMFSGPFFAFVYAGNLSNICTMVWAPLILRAVDGVLRGPKLPWSLCGAAAVAMQILAGHPQYVYFTALAIGFYLAIALRRAHDRRSVLLAFLAMYGGGAFLAAIQLVPGWVATQQSVRGAGVPYEFARRYSLPPENLVTLVAPGFFGDGHPASYWGKASLWEMNGFLGVCSLLLAIYGVFFGSRESGRFVFASLVLILLVLALGANTPLHEPLFQLLPGFASFRGSSKFLFPAALFLTALTTIGIDAILRQPRRAPAFLFGLIVVSIALWIGGAVIAHSARAGSYGRWAELLVAMRDQAHELHESYHTPADDYENSGFIAQSGQVAGASLQRSAYVCLLVGFLLVVCRWQPRAVYALPVLAILETFIFAWSWCPSFPVADVRTPNLEGFLAQQSRDARFIYGVNPNEAMTIGAYSVLGRDPMILRRYAELFAYAAHLPMAEVTQYAKYYPQPAIPSLYRLVRSHFMVTRSRQDNKWVYYISPLQKPLEHLLLVTDYQVCATRDEVFRAMSKETFDPTQTVILEDAPRPVPVALATNQPEVLGDARVVDESTDHLTIDADLRTPALLLITDAFAPGWRVESHADSAQEQYEIMPADWAFRAIPLSAGHHRFRLEYAPASFTYGAILSVLALCVWTVLVIHSTRQRAPHTAA